MILSDTPTEYLRDLQNASLYEMANVVPEDTGLQVTLWVSGKGGAKRGPRVKIFANGTHFKGDGDFSVSISDSPRIVAGKANVSERELTRIFSWIKLNQEWLLQLWNGEIVNQRKIYERIVRV